jgi:hypothetical protein
MQLIMGNIQMGVEVSLNDMVSDEGGDVTLN